MKQLFDYKEDLKSKEVRGVIHIKRKIYIFTDDGIFTMKESDLEVREKLLEGKNI